MRESLKGADHLLLFHLSLQSIISWKSEEASVYVPGTDLE